MTATKDGASASTTVEVLEATTYSVTLAYEFNVNVTAINNSAGHAKVIINGVPYINSGTIKVAGGTTVTLYANGYGSTHGQILVNGESVGAGTIRQYDVTPNTDMNVTLTIAYVSGYFAGRVTATYPI
mgnify:CR=1 FL=1